MSTQHTLGPWIVSRHGTPDYAPQYGIYTEDGRGDIAIVRGENAETDALVMAAAPDLLNALDALYSWVEGNVPYGTPDDIAAQIEAAIAKARGQV